MSPSYQHNDNSEVAFSVTCAVSNAASTEDITPSMLSIFVIVHRELACCDCIEGRQKGVGGVGESGGEGHAASIPSLGP